MPCIIIRFVAVIALCILLSGRAWAATGKEGPMAKVDHALAEVYEEQETSLAQGSGVVFTPSNPLLRVRAGRVVIDAVASGDVHALRADLEALGMQGAVVFGRIISGQLPIRAIKGMAALASLHFVRPAYATTHVGLVTSQGDQAMRADVARAAFGVDGTGVTVGVLSDSFNCLGGATADVASDDLSPVTVIQEVPNCSGGTDEGRAMLQLVHDVAPGANLAFATAFLGQAGFANNILALQAAGAGVIVDDAIVLTEPMFQDGIIAQAVNMVKGMGVAYFSAAGNQNRQSYESSFRAGPAFADGAFPSAPGARHFFGGTAHNFDPGPGVDVFQRITVPAGSGFTISFQWDSPFASVCPDCPGSPNDLDIYVFNDPPTTVLAGGTSRNIGGDAVEVFAFSNPPGAAVTAFNLMIIKFDGPNPQLIKYIRFGGTNVTINAFDTRSSTLYGHANAAGAEAVGAAFYGTTPAFGVAPPLLESFSSAGSTPILFDTAGHRLAIPEIRLKPEIVAPDGANTTFFGGREVEFDGFLNFFGTSAAAPHAAAVAALMLQAVPSTTPQIVYETLETTALDMGPPGFDFDSGFGLIQADKALDTLVSAAPEVIVYVGYLDNVQGTQNPVDIPTPFDPDETILISTGGVSTPHDTGVIRFENRTEVPVVIDPGLQVTTEHGVFQLWDSFLPVTLAPGQNLVLAETANFTFDTSGFGLAIDPVVSGSVNGQAFAFTDTARVLLGREDGSARDLNKTTPYQILGRIAGQEAVSTPGVSEKNRCIRTVSRRGRDETHCRRSTSAWGG
jgi:subtilisin family serine protease